MFFHFFFTSHHHILHQPTRILSEPKSFTIFFTHVFFMFSLVGGFNPSEKYESQWDGLSGNPIYEMENNKCLKPPTRYIIHEIKY